MVLLQVIEGCNRSGLDILNGYLKEFDADSQNILVVLS
jgi:hypothetical protein